MKVFCPMANADCHEEDCICWGRFPIVNPQTGQPTGKIAGQGCMVYNKIIKMEKEEKVKNA